MPKFTRENFTFLYFSFFLMLSLLSVAGNYVNLNIFITKSAVCLFEGFTKDSKINDEESLIRKISLLKIPIKLNFAYLHVNFKMQNTN